MMITNHWKKLMLPLIVILVSLVSLFPVVNMFFWRDDYTLLYKIQQHESASYPYQLVVPYFTPLYQWFGINPSGYFVLGLMLYALSSVTVFIFFRSITDSFTALAASLLYASGLVSLENMIQITYADGIPVFVILLTLSQCYLVKFIKKDNARYFSLSIFLYILLLQLFPHRAHLVYLYILATDLLVLGNKASLRQIFKRQVPFLLLYVAWYIIPAGGSGQSISLLKTHVYNSIINFTNLLIVPLDVLWPAAVAFSQNAKTIIGIVIAVSSLILIRTSWHSHARLGRVHAYAFLLVIGGLAAYLVFNPEFVISGMSRYHTYTQLGFVLYIASGFSLLRSLASRRTVKMFLTIILGGYILTSIAATLVYTSGLNKSHSFPAKRFYKELKAFLPNLQPDALLYIDKTNTLPYDPSEFIRVGRLSTEAAFAAMYTIPMQNLRYTENFDDVIKFAKENPSKISSIHSFYLSQSRLLDTTKSVQSYFVSAKEITDLSGKWKTETLVQTNYADCNGGYSVGIPPTITSPNLDIPSATPVTLQFSLRITPLPMSSVTYPYYQSPPTHEEETVAHPCKDITGKKRMETKQFQRLIWLEQSKYAQSLPSVTASSYSPPDLAFYAADGDIRTLWTADVSAWNKDGSVSVTLDLPQAQLVERVLLTPGSSQRLPTTLTVSVRQSPGDSWQIAQSITQANMVEYEPHEVFVPATLTKQILITIEQTNTRLAPQLAEVRVLSGEWHDLALSDITRYRANPYGAVPDISAMLSLQRAWQYALPLRLYLKKDKDWDFLRGNYVEFTGLADGALHTYTITIPAGGRTLERIRLAGFIIPAQISLGY